MHSGDRRTRCGGASEILRKGKMFRITWDTNGEVVFNVSGRLDAESGGDLKALFSSEANGRRISRDEPPPARAPLSRVLSFLEPT